MSFDILHRPIGAHGSMAETKAAKSRTRAEKGRKRLTNARGCGMFVPCHYSYLIGLESLSREHFLDSSIFAWKQAVSKATLLCSLADG